MMGIMFTTLTVGMVPQVGAYVKIYQITHFKYVYVNDSSTKLFKCSTYLVLLMAYYENFLEGDNGYI